MLTSKGKLDARLAAGIRKEICDENKQSFTPKKYSGNNMFSFFVAQDELALRKQIMEHYDMYIWQGGVLRLAPRWHQKAITRGVTLDSSWSNPVTWERRMLQAPVVRVTASRGSARSGADNASGVVCMNDNTKDKGYTWNTCERDHICSRKGCDKKHPAFEHK